MLRPFRAYLAAHLLPYTKPLLGTLTFRACKLGCGSAIKSSFIARTLHKLYARTASPSNLYFQDRSAISAAARSYSKRSVEGEGAAALQ